METICLLLYIGMTFFAMSYGHLDKARKDPEYGEPKWVFALIYGIISTALLTLYYQAGIFYFITGYEGTKIAMLVYLILFGISVAIQVYKRPIHIVTAGVTVALIAGMDGYRQLGVMLN